MFIYYMHALHANNDTTAALQPTRARKPVPCQVGQMVLLEVKRSEKKNEFLYETTVKVPGLHPPKIHMKFICYIIQVVSIYIYKYVDIYVYTHKLNICE